LRCWLCAVAAARLWRAADADVAGLRGRALRRRDIPGLGTPVWGGRTFSLSPAAANIWSESRSVPESVVGNMDPVAPYDRVDKTWVDSLTNAAPLGPSERFATARDYQPPMPPDYVPPYNRPRTFPADEVAHDAAEDDSPVLHLADKKVVGPFDKLRPAYGTWEYMKSDAIDATGNYPLEAPADSLAGELVSTGDNIPRRLRRFMEQIHTRREKLKDWKQYGDIFNKSDTNQDGAISSDEFEAELQGKQNKSAEEADRLWGKFQAGRSNDMSKMDFQRLARTGFDLGAINRSDISSILTVPSIASRGFWGSGAACPTGANVVGARFKVMPPSGTADNTGLNAVGLRCSDGTDVQTIEGPDGEWSDWVECPKGQRVYGYRVQNQDLGRDADSAGLRGMEFSCRTPDLSAFSKIKAGGKALGSMTSAQDLASGWSPELFCKPKEAVCGAQANVLRDQGAGDDMGMTDIRVYCCPAKVDCSEICKGEEAAASLKCAVCRQVVGMP